MIEGLCIEKVKANDLLHVNSISTRQYKKKICFPNPLLIQQKLCFRPNIFCRVFY